MNTIPASFPGNIPEIPGIGVDNFEDTTKRAYFLSHCHADHITGLKDLPLHIGSQSVCIYMSDISAVIVETHINKDLKEFIKPLLGKATIKLPADEKNGYEEMYVDVTPIPARHCFGSVMFLFETALNKVLYTGDFRITENSVSKMAQLHDNNNEPIKLDVLYVDTTFQDASYEKFPKRSETVAYVVKEIEKWLNKGDEYRVALETSARYGYEQVFNKIFEHMQMKVYVDGENWSLYSKLLNNLPGVTNDKSSTKIHLCSKRDRWSKETEKKYCSVCPNDRKHKYLYICFSAKIWKNGTNSPYAEMKPIAIDSDNQISVCYSTHSSRSELVHFVEYLNPNKVVGFSEPYTYKATEKLTCITPTKRKTPTKIVDQPTDEKRNKVPKQILRDIFQGSPSKGSL